MKKLVKYLALLLGVLSIFLFFNTYKLKSKQLEGVAPAPQLTLSDTVINHLAQAIRFRTVSNMDITQIDSAQFEQFIAYIAKAFPLTHSKLSFERINSFSLLYKWEGKNPALKPAMLMGHYDVVPVIQGTEKLWQHKPFDGEIVDGYLYGRGAMDDKTTVMGVLEAVELLLQQGFQPERSFYLSFGHDEEVSGVQGARKTSALLESRKVELEYVIDEGGMIKSDGVAGITKPIAFVGIAEKGYTTLILTSTGEGGHSSMPPPQTSIGMLAEAIDKLQKNPFPASINGAVGHMQDYLAPEMPFLNKLAMANRWLFKPLIINSLAKSNSGNASVRTTTAPTIVDAGVKDNVLPIDAMAKINFRILPGDSVQGVINYVKKVINNEKITVESITTFDSNPSPVSDTASYGFRLIHSTIKKCFPDVIVSPNLVVGATDSRFYKNLTPNIFRFMPIRIGDEDLKRVHGTNERISVSDFKNVVRFYMELVKGS
jgi:carboxypeptidase PM20D1